MSGHNKWSKIKHAKGALDAKRGKLFSKLSKEITVAARDGGTDPDLNARLRLAITSAKAQNMPGDTIDRAINKGSGEIEGVNYEHCIYEGYAPGGAALMVEILTENKNRAAADIRSIFKKNQGSLGTSGSVSYLFEHKGEIHVPIGAASEERILELALEAGAEDVTPDGEKYVIITANDQLNAVANNLRGQEVEISAQGLVFIPQTGVAIEDASTATQVLRLFNALDDYADSQNVFSNFDIPDEILDAVEL
jgi:YebC/PmpR family DNA-binding regulatory protein